MICWFSRIFIHHAKIIKWKGLVSFLLFCASFLFLFLMKYSNDKAFCSELWDPRGTKTRTIARNFIPKYYRVPPKKTQCVLFEFICEKSLNAWDLMTSRRRIRIEGWNFGVEFLGPQIINFFLGVWNPLTFAHPILYWAFLLKILFFGSFKEKL
jgi:hypothetical protein